MICIRCKKEIKIRNRPDGLPNGIGMMFEDGTLINLCTDCVIETEAISRDAKRWLYEHTTGFERLNGKN